MNRILLLALVVPLLSSAQTFTGAIAGRVTLLLRAHTGYIVGKARGLLEAHAGPAKIAARSSALTADRDLRRSRVTLA